MATITSAQGFVNDGSGNLTIQGATVVNNLYMSAVPLPGSGSGAAPVGFIGPVVSIPNPGFYQVAVTGSSGGDGGLQRGAGGFTGSLPNPASFPGGEILITDTLGLYNYMLTGSICMMSGTTGAVAGSINGTKLKVTAGGTVGLWSDSKGWLICAASGTLTLTA